MKATDQLERIAAPHDLLPPKFVPVAWLQKAWDEAFKPSPITQMIRDTHADAEINERNAE